MINVDTRWRQFAIPWPLSTGPEAAHLLLPVVQADRRTERLYRKLHWQQWKVTLVLNVFSLKV